MYQTASSTSSLKFLVPLLLLLSACGFKPVYGTDNNSELATKLAAVKVEDIPARDGQVLQYKLADLLNPAHLAANDEYIIKIRLTKGKSELGISGDLRVTRYDIIETANYQLISLSDNRELDRGEVRIKSSYNRTESEFSTFVSEQDAGEKAAKELAEELRSRLVYYFSK